MPKGRIDSLNEVSNFPELLMDLFLLMALTNKSKEKDFILEVENRLLVGLFRHQDASVQFHQLNSYFRMLVHRVTRFYGFQRVADPVSRTVTVFKPSNDYARPLLKLAEVVEPSLNTPPTVESLRGTESYTSSSSTVQAPRSKFTIMRRNKGEGEDSSSLSENSRTKPAKTLEEREKEYEEARNRIFMAAAEEERQVEETLQDNEIIQEQEEEEEKIHFEGWKNVEKIKPFIPSSQPAAPSVPTPSEEDDIGLDLSKLWIPRHIFIIRNLKDQDDQNQKLKTLCKKNFCKLHRSSQGDTGLLIFSYKVGLTEAELTNIFGYQIELWRPFFLPEPPN